MKKSNTFAIEFSLKGIAHLASDRIFRLASYRQIAEKPPQSVDFPIPSEFHLLINMVSP